MNNYHIRNGTSGTGGFTKMTVDGVEPREPSVNKHVIVLIICKLHKYLVVYGKWLVIRCKKNNYYRGARIQVSLLL